MIQTYIYLDKTSSLYKNLKKRGIIDAFGESLFIWLKYKPSIGELISIDACTIDGECKLKTFLTNRHKSIILRITDLCQERMYNSDIDVLRLKCYEDIFIR